MEEQQPVPTKLCEHCQVLSFDESCLKSVKEGDGPNLSYKRQDTYPGLPSLKASAENGCGFCGILREVIEFEVPGMRREADKNLTEDMLSLDLNPKQFDVKMDGIRCVAMEENNGVLGLRHFLLGVRVTEAQVGSGGGGGGKLEDCGGLDMTFDISAYPGDIAARKLKIGRQPIGNYPLSSRNINLIKTWLHICKEKHSCPGFEPQRLPTRVIDIGDEGADPRLLETTDRETGRYLAFSYQWGSPLITAPPLKTTKANFQQYLCRIPAADLPKSFTDLIQVTRELGEHLIWVDSLCIIQDDEQDWLRESLKMRHIFRNSLLTIAAASITSSHESFLGSRNLWPRVAVPFAAKRGTHGNGTIYISPTLTGKYQSTQKFVTNIGQTDWNRRGWTFQERELSRRTLFFGKNQLHYECAAARWEEEGAIEAPVVQPWKIAVNDAAELTLEEIWPIWYRWVTEFSRRRFTIEKDRLPALAGLAQLVAERMSRIGQGVQQKYLAGLWSGDLTRGLLWRRDNNNAWEDSSEIIKGPYLAPSWSWPSLRGGVEWRLGNRYINACKIIDAVIQNVNDDPMGRVVSGSLVVEGKLVELKPQISRQKVVGRTDFHTERIIHDLYTQGEPSHLDLSCEGNRFGNALFDEFITMEDGVWYEIAPFRLQVQGMNMFALLLAWEEHREEEGARTNKPRTLGLLSRPDKLLRRAWACIGNSARTSCSLLRRAWSSKASSDHHSRRDGVGEDNNNDPKERRNAVRVEAHDPDSDLRHYRDRRHGHDDDDDDNDGQFQRKALWPAGLLLSAATTDAQGRPSSYRRIGMFERIVETDAAAARSVFDGCDTQVVTIV